MSSPIIARYKIPFLFALVIALSLLILGGQVHWFPAIFAFSGAILGVVFLDLEYLIHAYLIDPSADFSVRIKEYISAGNYSGLIDFYNREEYSFGELSIRSVVSQVLLVIFSLMSLTNAAGLFAQGLLLSMTINMLYSQLQEYLKTGTLQRWFWVFNGTLTPALYKGYMIVIFLFFLYQFTFI